MLEFIELDVSELAPPEPMTNILQALAKLRNDQCLQVRHSRQPYPLYEKLIQAGWGYHCDQLSDNQVTLYIFKQDNHSRFEQMRFNHLQNDSLSKDKTCP
jgi:uncharacterized protein (DUF2249 family)